VSVVSETPAIEIGLKALVTSRPRGHRGMFVMEPAASSPSAGGPVASVEGGRAREITWTGADAADGTSFAATADGFEVFKTHEVGRFVAARERGERYVPSDPRYFIAARWRGHDAPPPTSPDHFAVLEQPADEQEFSGWFVADGWPAWTRRASRRGL
jgi:hypothetical protein